MRFLTPRSLYFITLPSRCRKEKRIFCYNNNNNKSVGGGVWVPKPEGRNELETSINSSVVLIWSSIESARGRLHFVK